MVNLLAVLEECLTQKVKKLHEIMGLQFSKTPSKVQSNKKRGGGCSLCSEKKNIVAILQHDVRSEHPAKQHQYYLPGESSWCKWLQDEATGTSTYDGGSCLPRVFHEVLKTTFMTSSDSKLLERCVLGTTQNPIKPVNASTPWCGYCVPKTMILK